MKKIPKVIIENRFDENDNDKILETTVMFQVYDDAENMNARIVLTNEYVQEKEDNDEFTLNDLTEDEKVVYARQRAAEWILFDNETLPE